MPLKIFTPPKVREQTAEPLESRTPMFNMPKIPAEITPGS